jgi:hypothetical protein
LKQRPREFPSGHKYVGVNDDLHFSRRTRVMASETSVRVKPAFLACLPASAINPSNSAMDGATIVFRMITSSFPTTTNRDPLFNFSRLRISSGISLQGKCSRINEPAPAFFDLRPVHNQFSLVPGTVCQVRIDQVLIGNTRHLRHFFKVFNRLNTQAYGHLFLQPSDMGIFSAGHT